MSQDNISVRRGIRSNRFANVSVYVRDAGTVPIETGPVEFIGIDETDGALYFAGMPPGNKTITWRFPANLVIEFEMG